MASGEVSRYGVVLNGRTFGGEQRRETIPNEVWCDNCGDLCKPGAITTGYAVMQSQYGPRYLCYPCAGEVEKAEMIAHGRAVLYYDPNKHTISNWTGTFSFHPYGYVHKGGHNFTGKRLDMWIRFDGHVWHGVNCSPDWQDCVQFTRTKATR